MLTNGPQFVIAVAAFGLAVGDMNVDVQRVLFLQDIGVFNLQQIEWWILKGEVSACEVKVHHYPAPKVVCKLEVLVRYFLNTLPVALRGRSSTRTNSRGTLKGANIFLHAARNSSIDTIPDLGTT